MFQYDTKFLYLSLHLNLGNLKSRYSKQVNPLTSAILKWLPTKYFFYQDSLKDIELLQRFFSLVF